MALKSQGFKEVTKELERIKSSVAPNIASAVNDANEYGQTLAIDTIFQRYGFRKRSYVEQHFSLSFDRHSLQGRISARLRPSTANRFIQSPHSRTGKKGQKVPAGFTVAFMRNEPKWFKGAFNFIGRNGNEVMYVRNRGEKWRTWKEAKKLYKNKGAYGPSVGGSFDVIRDDIEPAIIQFLRERYLVNSR